MIGSISVLLQSQQALLELVAAKSGVTEAERGELARQRQALVGQHGLPTSIAAQGRKFVHDASTPRDDGGENAILRQKTRAPVAANPGRMDEYEA